MSCCQTQNHLHRLEVANEFRARLVFHQSAHAANHDELVLGPGDGDVQTPPVVEQFSFLQRQAMNKRPRF